MSAPDKLKANSNPPWWKLPIVWLVIAGPAIVVVASLVTAGIAIKHVDPVLDTSKGHVKSTVEEPAMRARNHAASPSLQPADR
ncbi:nitrogen fixation protein FixH [Aquabacterium sp. UBA2148]|uniref:nitrogen fixation protein FixH n=1 Tax=Aquabacterium sp. UBA2148 TaxID=1946042 RepID=UPI002580D8AD|nr:nitrogen fixation protein FixH [Aquabacterium sp. UBA2148]